MTDQIELIAKLPWDVLVILDACRYDAFQRTVGSAGGELQAVRSPACCTPAWLKAAIPFLAWRNPVYVNANPVVDRQTDALLAGGVSLLSLWCRHWGRFTSLGIPTVHPMSVTTAAILASEREPGRSLVAHYIQPHSPYIGEVPLALVGCGTQPHHPLTQACRALERPDRAVKAGRITWPEVREAYLANLRLAWEAVRVLAGALEGRRIVVTADHGEVLGEHGGRFGHQCRWTDFEELRIVPWLELAPAGPGDAETTKQKLEALGYV